MLSAMRGRFQWRTSLRIRASRERLWTIVDDISLIPKYHAEVGQVELLSRLSTRAIGVKYRCTILEGRKGSCVEEVVDCIPGERFATAFAEDTWGVSKMLRDFVVDTILVPHGDFETDAVLEAYYEPIGWKMRVLNALLLRRLMARRALRTIEGVKRLAEAT